MSVTSGGTAPNPCSSGGRSALSAGSAGMSMIFFASHRLLPFDPARCHTQTDAERSLSEVTTPAKP